MRLIQTHKITDPIILTTLPHYIAAYYAYQIHLYYAIIIFLSSTLSIIWHMYQTNKLFFYLDYALAFIWFLADLILSIETKNQSTIFTVIILNGIIAATNQVKFRNITYETIHSIWHCLSWSKGIFIIFILENA